MTISRLPRPLTAQPSGPLRGLASPPGDKSISHRALILGALAVGESSIGGLLEAEDVLNTAASLRLLGADVGRDVEGIWHVYGVGVGGWAEPAGPLDFGNSGTGCRLMMGAIATTPITAIFTGDASLSRRPMGRVLDPLTLFGMSYRAREGGLLPVTLSGARAAIPVHHEMKVASAQVKSALLLAALNAPGRSTVIQTSLTRDHTEKMLAGSGARIGVESLGARGEAITIEGETELKPIALMVPRDPSSAAFPLAAALIVRGSEVLVRGVLLNPRRAGVFECWREMGADIVIDNARIEGGETVGDITARFGDLKGVDVGPERAPSMIDEYPILAVTAAFAVGRTVLRGLEELRVKESDRLAAIAAGLKAIGIKVEETKDTLSIEGRGPDGVPGMKRDSAAIQTHMDHRIAMSFLIAGLAAQRPVTVDDTHMIGTSFPGFVELMSELGADLSVH